MAIDRSKFKSTQTSSMIEKDKEVETKLRGTSGSLDYHKIEDGKNLFRAYPAHPVEGEEVEQNQFAETKCVTYLPAMVEEWVDGRVVNGPDGKPKLKEGRKSVFNARIHGNAPKDLVEEYITFMDKLSKETFTEEAKRKEFMEHIYGKYSKNPAERIQSSSYSTTWTMYADKYTSANPNTTPTFGRLEIKKTVKERLNKIASQMDTPDQPMETDPFTDVNEGRAFYITFNKDAEKAADYYTTDIDSSTVEEKIGTRTVKVLRTYPLSDEQLENFEKYPSLISMFKNVFKKKDFDFQMEGLKMLDDKIKNKYGVGAFAYDKWLDICEEVSNFFPEEEAEEGDDSNAGEAENETPREETGETGDEFESMTRQELKTFAQLNRTGIIIKPADSDDELREKCREWKSLQSTEEDSSVEDDAKDRIKKLKEQAALRAQA